jgi:uncharacterized protein
MDQWFSIKTHEKDTVALLGKKNGAGINSEEVTYESLAAWIESKGIKHCIQNEVLHNVVQNTEIFNYPAEIAIGQLPVHGEPAQLMPVAETQPYQDKAENEKFDFKRLFAIPTVAFCQLVAKKKPATEGTPGITVFGNPIPPKKGKDIKVRNGENTVFNEENLGVYATASGEVSYRSNCVDVYSVYRVNGDLSLKTGHIHFTGNVHVTGDVPSGFKITAKGDVRIEGLVEAAEIFTPGNVIVGGECLVKGKDQFAAGELH